MRLYIATDTWEWMHGNLVVTASMLKASGVHADEAEPLAAHLVTWQALDSERRQAENAVDEADAHAAWKNLVLDPLTTRFGALLLADCGSDRKHATFVKFFPSPVNEVTRLALDAQLAAMEDFPIVAAEVKLSKPTNAALKDVLACMVESKAVCEARKETARGVTRVSLKQDAWRDEANRRRRTAENALAAYATAHDLPRGYPDGFFPSPKAAKKAAPPSEADLVLALPDAALRALAATYIATLPADAQAAIHARLTR
jgi:hypothetical protein